MPKHSYLSALCLTIALAMPAQGQNVLWQTLYDAGVSAQAKGNLSDAEKQFAAAAKNAGNDQDLLKATSKLAYIYDVEGKFPEAQEQYDRVLQLDRKLHGQMSLEAGTDLNSLALVCQHGGKFNDASAYFKQAAELFEKNNKKPEMAATLTNLALLMQETARYELVEPLFKRALELYEKAGDRQAQANVLDRYAAFCQMESRYSEAEALYGRALLLRKEKLGESSPAVADTLCELGQLHTAQGDLKKGEDELRQALGIVKLTAQARSQEADISTALADCLRQQQKLPAARELYQNALDILQASTGTSNAKVAEALRNLAQSYVDSGDYVKAEGLLVKALATDEKAYGALHPDLAVDLQTLGLLYLEQGKYDRAEPFYKRALGLSESVLGPDHPATATSLNNLAWLYYNMGKYEQAEPLVLRAMAIRQKQFGAKHPLYAANLSIFAVILAAEKKYDEAERTLQKAIAAEEESLGVDHPDISENLKNLAVIYVAMGRNAEADDTLHKLLARDEKAFGEGGAPVASDLEALAAVLTKEKKQGEAQQLLARAQSIKSKLPGAQPPGARQRQYLSGGTIGSGTTSTGATGQTGSSTSTQSATGSGTTSGESVDLSTPSKMDRPVKDKWALVVGISNFRDPSINLRYAAKDATDFANYLVSDAHFAADHVRLLTDSQATHEKIVSMLGEGWLRRVANSDDLVCIYISSHGSPAQKEADSKNFVVPYEGNIENIVFTGIPMQWLTAGLKNLVHSDRMVVLLDVCHGGAVLSATKSLERTNIIDPANIEVGDGQVVMASSSAEQTSWESRNYQNGVFTRRLIEGLRQKGAQTTLDQAFAYMKARVEEEVLRDRAAVQTPIMEKKWEGRDIFLGILPSAPRASLPAAGAKTIGAPSKPAAKTGH